MAYSTKKNLLKSKDQYNRYYGDFRGVDFSSDHTQVNERRLAYAVNMYKDYQSGQGQALETIPGFRRRVFLPEEVEVYGIHHFTHKDENGNSVVKILFHAGERLYLWHNYPNTIDVTLKKLITLPAMSANVGTTKIFKITLEDNVFDVVSVAKIDGEDMSLNFEYNAEIHELTVSRSDLDEGNYIVVSYIEGNITTDDAIFNGMNTARSTSFIFNNRLYIIDGKNYLVYDGARVVSATENAYVPTTYINIIPSGENSDNGVEYEQRNLLSPYFKHTFIADGETTEFYMNDYMLEAISEVKVYGTVVTNYSADLENGKITFDEAPAKPEETVQIAGADEASNVMYPEFYAGVEITAKKTITDVTGVCESDERIGKIITDCTIATVFYNRVFFSGNPNYPNHIFYCGRNLTGYVDPTYFGILNYMQDGVGITPITGMIPVADTLMVLKGDTQQDGAVFFHTPTDTGNDIQPTIYPSTQGLAGIGCLGACINFLDDPIFISRLGVEAIGQLSVRYERAIEHRSSLIDAKLVNANLSRAVVEEWNGYLLVLIDGMIFMADSRQKYTHEIGVPQYEWYYLEDIGIYRGQYPEYRYSSQEYEYFENTKVHICKNCKKSEKNCTCEKSEIIEIPLVLADKVINAYNGETEDLRGTIANPANDSGEESREVFYDIVNVQIDDNSYDIGIYYTVHEIYNVVSGELIGYEALLCDSCKGANTGGVFHAATMLKSMEKNLFFGTSNGVICSFNFDMRDEFGAIAPIWYSFDERAIVCGCATKMDSCSVPHLTKTTVKKSTVIKTKSFQESAAKIKVRTNRKMYAQIARINSGTFTFEDTDFSDFTFNTSEQSLFAVKEKEKKWVEKQYYIYSDEYQKPFALYYISFRYKIAGRFKE